MKNYDEICRAAIGCFGIKSQVDVAHEELGELEVALYHFKRGKAEMNDVRTEIADVAIMTYQLALIFGIEEVQAEIDKKLERLEGRLAK